MAFEHRSLTEAQSQERRQSRERALELTCAFQRMRIHPEVAYHLSCAIYSLQLGATPKAPQLADALRARLVDDVHATTPIILRAFADERPDLVKRCIRAVLFLTEYWAMDPDARRKCAHLTSDANAYARWLRNAAHNQSLLEEIDERAEKRRSDLIRMLASATLEERSSA